jgi:hypothetical protein
MTRPLQVTRLTENGEIRTADLIASIAKHLTFLCTAEFNGSPIRARELRKYAERLAKLAKALEGSQ